MNELKIFSNPSFGNVRVVEKDGEPWFVARDVCDCLGLENVAKALAGLEHDEISTLTISNTLNDTSGLRKDSRIVSEPGLYSLILRSRKPEAKAFKRWITHEVIPAIRRTGHYGVEAGISLDEATRRLMQTPLESITHLVRLCAGKNRQIEALEAKIERDRPKVQFADAMTVSNGCCTPRELALRIKKKFPVKIGPNRFLCYLRREGYLHKRGREYNLPTQKAIEKGIMDVGNATYLKKNGATKKVPIAVITQKGQQYFIAVFADGLLGWG